MRIVITLELDYRHVYNTERELLTVAEDIVTTLKSSTTGLLPEWVRCLGAYEVQKRGDR